MDRVKESLLISKEVHTIYEDILNSYVADFYVENHWNKLSNSWKIFFESANLSDIGFMLDFHNDLNTVFPLSLMCLRKLIIQHSISRDQKQLSQSMTLPEPFMKFFWKSIKEKKRHELALMSAKSYETALKSGCKYIVDIGSGVGHFSRMLAYGYGFTVCTFEANPDLVKQAYILDSQFEKILDIKKIPHKCKTSTVHINKRIENDLTSQEFVALVKEAFKLETDNFQFGIVGLHPCGNLGPTLLRLYSESKNANFINIASCCYMKLGLSTDFVGFPLSQFCINNNFNLSYLSCEIACHSIENYSNKLKLGLYNNLKVHAFRAALEQILEQIDPSLRHKQLCGVKYEDNLSVEEYCTKALRRLDLNIPESVFVKFDKIIDKTWKHVVCFYSVRLLLAPLVETIILYDRMLFVRENTGCCLIEPVFDCAISPRNHVLTAYKLFETYSLFYFIEIDYTVIILQIYKMLNLLEVI